MVSFHSYKRRRVGDECSPAETSTSAQQTARQRKQKLMSKLSDSGFEDDLESSPMSSPGRIDLSPLRSQDHPPACYQSSWYLQYGDVGYRIQREKEAQHHPCTSLARQPQLTAEARCKLVSWLIPVHKHLGLSFECCCLAVNIMDRFLASTAVAADCFQLLGVTALLLATKQVEVCSPSISHLLSLCCDAFSKEQLCNLECLVLLRLNFCLAVPTMAFFLDYYTNCIEAAQLDSEKTDDDERRAAISPGPASSRQRSKLAQRVCELSLADYAFNKYPPSLTASCALSVAGELMKTEPRLDENPRPQSQGDLWVCSVDELLTKAASGRPLESPALSKDDVHRKRLDFPPAGQESFDKLAQECKENLKLLVSLNQESLGVIHAIM